MPNCISSFPDMGSEQFYLGPFHGYPAFDVMRWSGGVAARLSIFCMIFSASVMASVIAASMAGEGLPPN